MEVIVRIGLSLLFLSSVLPQTTPQLVVPEEVAGKCFQVDQGRPGYEVFMKFLGDEHIQLFYKPLPKPGTNKQAAGDSSAWCVVHEMQGVMVDGVLMRRLSQKCASPLAALSGYSCTGDQTGYYVMDFSRQAPRFWNVNETCETRGSTLSWWNPATQDSWTRQWRPVSETNCVSSQCDNDMQSCDDFTISHRHPPPKIPSFPERKVVVTVDYFLPSSTRMCDVTYRQEQWELECDVCITNLRLSQGWGKDLSGPAEIVGQRINYFDNFGSPWRVTRCGNWTLQASLFSGVCYEGYRDRSADRAANIRLSIVSSCNNYNLPSHPTQGKVSPPTRAIILKEKKPTTPVSEEWVASLKKQHLAESPLHTPLSRKNRTFRMTNECHLVQPLGLLVSLWLIIMMLCL